MAKTPDEMEKEIDALKAQLLNVSDELKDAKRSRVANGPTPAITQEIEALKAEKLKLENRVKELEADLAKRPAAPVGGPAPENKSEEVPEHGFFG